MLCNLSAITRRRFNFALALSLLVLTAIPASAADSAAAWTRALYEREIAAQLVFAPRTEAAFLADFTPSTREAWLAARKGPGPRLEGPVLNAFFGWGVLPRQPIAFVAVEALSEVAGAARVAVDLVWRGEKRRVVVEARSVAGQWRIEDIAYPSGESFLVHQRACATGPC